MPVWVLEVLRKDSQRSLAPAIIEHRFLDAPPYTQVEPLYELAIRGDELLLSRLNAYPSWVIGLLYLSSE